MADLVSRLVVPFSGGIDSAVACLFVAERRAAAFAKVEVELVHVDYRQAAFSDEGQAAAQVFERIKEILSGADVTVTVTRRTLYIHDIYDDRHGGPSAYFPYRNLVLLSALAASAKPGSELVFGALCGDEGTPDYTPDASEAFVDALNQVLRLAGPVGEEPVTVVAPLLGHSKHWVFTYAQMFDEPGKPRLEDITVTCFQPIRSTQPCGSCRACETRSRVLAELAEDPSRGYE